MILFAGALIFGGFVGIAVAYHLTGPLALLGYVAGYGALAVVAVFSVVAAYNLTARRPEPGAVYVDEDGDVLVAEVEAYLKESAA